MRPFGLIGELKLESQNGNSRLVCLLNCREGLGYGAS